MAWHPHRTPARYNLSPVAGQCQMRWARLNEVGSARVKTLRQMLVGRKYVRRLQAALLTSSTPILRPGTQAPWRPSTQEQETLPTSMSSPSRTPR